MLAFLSLRRLTWSLLGAGAVLRVAAYLSNRSLWLDEAYLAPTILRRSWSALLAPPEHSQIVPVGFLILERAAVSLFGSSEYALRLVPLAAGLLALFLFRRIAARTLPAPAVPLAMGLFALSDGLIAFSSELKQYSTDVLIALLLLDLALTARVDTPGWRRPLVLLAAAGAAAPWLSFPSLFVMAGAGATLFEFAWRRRDRPRLAALGATVFLWGASAAVLRQVWIGTLARNAHLLDYWRGAFLPFPPDSLGALYWPVRATAALFGDPAGFVFRGLAILCFLVGAWRALRADRERTALLLAPILFALVASGLRLYPFAGRPMLFAVPLLLLLVAEGADRIRETTAARAPSIAVILYVLLLVHPTLFALRHLVRPRTREEIRPVLAHVEARRQPQDSLYVYAAAAPAFEYYVPRVGFPGDRILMGAWVGDSPKAGKDLERLREHGRVWALFSHSTRPDGTDDEARFLPLLDTAGERLDQFRAPGAAVYLYDMRQRPSGGESRP